MRRLRLHERSRWTGDAVTDRFGDTAYINKLAITIKNDEGEITGELFTEDAFAVLAKDHPVFLAALKLYDAFTERNDNAWEVHGAIKALCAAIDETTEEVTE